jgi:hypothetical protein
MTVSLENSVSKVFVRNIHSDHKRLAFERTLGLTGFDVLFTESGKLVAKGYGGFTKKVINDLEQFLYEGKIL